MTLNEEQAGSEREQTDESLRAEREKSDLALGESRTATEDAADAIIARARARADEVLATARAKTDKKMSSNPPSAQPLIKRDRLLEDRVLEAERAGADEILRVERAEHVALLERERDETDKDLLSERTRSDDALATRDEFLGIVSHDLRNLLNTMVLSARLIDEVLSENDHVEQVRRNADRIARAGTRMDRLIGDLVDVSSIEAGVLTVVRQAADPAEVIHEAVHAFQAQASASGISIETEIAPSASPAMFDHARILQVLVNLLGNALKFTHAQGKVVIRVDSIADAVRFSVRDNGQGIPASKLEAIFGRYVQITTNDRRGVGLGLYISKCIVEGHGGRIWAESKVGEGSTFWFTLPTHPDP